MWFTICSVASRLLKIAVEKPELSCLPFEGIFDVFMETCTVWDIHVHVYCLKLPLGLLAVVFLLQTNKNYAGILAAVYCNHHRSRHNKTENLPAYFSPGYMICSFLTYCWRWWHMTLRSCHCLTHPSLNTVSTLPLQY